MAFKGEHATRGASYAVVALCFAVVLLCGTCLFRRTDGQAMGRLPDASWMLFVFLTALLAWTSGLVLGCVNFIAFVSPYERLRDMRSYRGIVPSRAQGELLVDAGTIELVSGSKVDVAKSMGFRHLHGNMYCVAPIVDPNSTTSSNGTRGIFDLWAVGTNCCSAGSAGFRCGGSGDPRALSGMRMLTDRALPFFRLAVREAEAAHRLTARHPLFFHLVEDAGAVEEGWRWGALREYQVGAVGYFLLQALLVALEAFRSPKSWL